MTIFGCIFVVSLVCIVGVIESRSCDEEIAEMMEGKTKTLELKVVGIASILIAGAIGVSIPICGNKISKLNPESNMFMFFLIKAFAAGVILATGFVHILPDAFESLNSPCLQQKPWGQFPFAGFVAMISAIMTMMIDCIATSYYKRSQNLGVIDGDEEMLQGKLHVHTHASHGHAHGSDHLFRHRLVSQVLEVGIVVHSVIIGISVGASRSKNVIKPLVGALTFHQFFEGMGLGGCISQANYRWRAIVVMVVCFSMTTPIGIGIGMGISHMESTSKSKSNTTTNTNTGVEVEGVLSAASAGILIYMALVDLLAQDFMNPKMQSNLRLQLASYLSLLLGMASMSLLAKWA